MEATLTQALAEYIEQRKQNKLEPLQKALNKVLDKGDEVSIAEAKAEYVEKAAPIEQSFKPETWLTDAARRAKQISLATHAIKFTHSDAKATSILVTKTEQEQKGYLVTANLDDKAIDAVGNAAALDVARLLKIQVGGESLVSQLQQGQAPSLSAFTDNTELLQNWIQGFKLALVDEKLTSHTLSKQVYFPLGQNSDEEYHLLCPLFSSTLSHRLHAKVTSTRFGDSKEVRDARKANKFDERIDASFPNTAVQTFGGSKPQNISQLNSERYGQSFLLSCAPPNFERQTNPPLKQKSLFNRRLSFKVAGYLREFKRFLETLRPDQRNFKIRYKRDQGFIAPILDQLMVYAASIQALPAGWSNDSDCELKFSHTFWLDIHNPDEAFQREREKLDWQNEVASDFASWLSRQLKSDKYLLSDSEHAYFAKLCLHQLKQFERSTPKHPSKQEVE